ncbi:MazG-like nucleotide pyrophosphohydrolase [Streptomyces phage Coruscant]|uniref:MazG-like nucleotide pyrophosphohydrolase n=1 Tax=Streptomyces phage Coruscant TaxID=2739834 RepID=A0A7G4AW23_9CAUD|nr:MazG-like pyrophosphatase [Streptomyces phage Coruscant]QMP84213.1 MazG-like nucleotide pyrophosphohydrolase [Streptomyces phage Coruscant]
MTDISFDAYQLATSETAIYPEANKGTFKAINYCLVGASGEVGEIMNKLGKIIRDNDSEISYEQRKDFTKEVGDVIWFLTRAVDEMGFSMEVVLQENLAKLRSRKERGVLSGSGDNR